MLRFGAIRLCKPTYFVSGGARTPFHSPLAHLPPQMHTQITESHIHQTRPDRGVLGGLTHLQRIKRLRGSAAGAAEGSALIAAHTILSHHMANQCECATQVDFISGFQLLSWDTPHYLPCGGPSVHFPTCPPELVEAVAQCKRHHGAGRLDVSSYACKCLGVSIVFNTVCYFINAIQHLHVVFCFTACILVATRCLGIPRTLRIC